MDCILWEGALNSGGYPVTWQNGKTVYAHRIVVNAPKGSVVRHTCDKPNCVNPEHLVVGSSLENSRDMVSKGRQAFGERCTHSKLTDDTVKEIKSYQGILSSRKVAIKYNISKTNILDIWNKKIWKHLQ